MIQIHHDEFHYLSDKQKHNLLVLWDKQLSRLSAPQRIEWALEQVSKQAVLSTSFGIQSAVLLHLISTIQPTMPVVFIDTGYLFPETYQYAELMTERLSLNLHITLPRISSAWQETKYGRLWEQGIAGIDRYNNLNKIEPMQRSLQELSAQLWIAGPRREQATTRANLAFIEQSQFHLPKLHPILDWSTRQVYQYMQKHQLPFHPLWQKAYVSVGDTHSTVPLTEGMTEEQTRYFGLKRECGLHG